MAKHLALEELQDKEKVLLLRAFDFDVDKKGFILNKYGKRIRSKENPSSYLTLKSVALKTGSLQLIDGSPASISKFLREEVEETNDRDSDKRTSKSD